MAIKTQGTELFIIDRTTPATPKVVKFSCPTGITGLGGGGTDEIDTTCLDATSKSFELGLSDNGELSIPFVFKGGDDASHKLVFDLAHAKSNVECVIALSDGTAAPTVGTTDPKDVVPPTDRTSFVFHAGVKAPQLDIAGNEVIRGTLSLRVSGSITVHWAGGSDTSVIG